MLLSIAELPKEGNNESVRLNLRGWAGSWRDGNERDRLTAAACWSQLPLLLPIRRSALDRPPASAFYSPSHPS